MEGISAAFNCRNMLWRKVSTFETFIDDILQIYNCSCRDLVHKLGTSLVESFYHSTSYDELVEVSVTDGNDGSLGQIWIISGVH